MQCLCCKQEVNPEYMMRTGVCFYCDNDINDARAERERHEMSLDDYEEEESE